MYIAGFSITYWSTFQVVHVINHHKKDSPHWTVFDSEHRDRILEQENGNRRDPAFRFLCKHCKHPATNLTRIIEHVRIRQVLGFRLLYIPPAYASGISHERGPSAADYSIDPTVSPLPVVLTL